MAKNRDRNSNENNSQDRNSDTTEATNDTQTINMEDVGNATQLLGSVDSNTVPESDASNAVSTNLSPEDKEAKHKAILANFDNKVDIKEFKFHFKKMKDEATGLESKRPTVELSLPIPSVEGIVSILENGGKGLELLQEAVQSIIVDRAREILNDKEDATQDNFPLSDLGWEAIALLPRAERRGGGISKEVWEEFAKDYINVMPAITNKTAEQVGNAAKIFLNKFNACKTNKPVLKRLKEQLSIYASNSPNAETYTDAIAFLAEKADNLINLDESILLNNL